MQPYVSVITLGVAELTRSKRFYVEGFGWKPAFEDDTIVFYQLNVSYWRQKETPVSGDRGRDRRSAAGYGTIPRQAQAKLANERGPSGLPLSYASRTAAVALLSSSASSWPTNLPSGPSPAAMGAHRSSKSR